MFAIKKQILKYQFFITIFLVSSLMVSSYFFFNTYHRRKDLVAPLFNQALAASGKGDLEGAIALYKQIVSYDPECAIAYFNCGQLHVRLQQWQDAEQCFINVFSLGYNGPNKHLMHSAYASVLDHLQKNNEALEQLNNAVMLDPNYTPHYVQRGLLLQKMNYLEDAFKDFWYATSITADYAKTFINLGNAYRDRQDFENAINCYQQVIDAIPNYYASYLCMADVVHLQAKQQADDKLVARAMDLYTKAVQLEPTCYQALHNLGFMHLEQGKVKKALQLFNTALTLIDDPVIHFGKGVCHLQLGQLEKGWQEYEWRWKGMLHHNHHNIPQWTGQDLTNKTILLHVEQAFGDTFQFIRYAELLRQKGATVIVEVHKPLKAIISLCPYINRVITQAEQAPACDYQLPCMSAPLVFKTTLNTIPHTIPYLFVDEKLVNEWRTKLGKSAGLKIGICWECNLQHEMTEYRNDKGTQFKIPTPKRSVLLELFKEIAQIPGVQLYSLQKYSAQNVSNDFVVHTFDNLDEHAGAFMDTAALIKNVDLVISVDTSIAHLAGGLGVNTWVLLPHAAEWRWLEKRTDSPWYPTMTLFRQQQAGDWEGVISQVVKQLKFLKRNI